MVYCESDVFAADSFPDNASFPPVASLTREVNVGRRALPPTVLHGTAPSLATTQIYRKPSKRDVMENLLAHYATRDHDGEIEGAEDQSRRRLGQARAARPGIHRPPRHAQPQPRRQQDGGNAPPTRDEGTG
ncbi:hypothetical protein GCM10023205_52900 [Yinghuangia aomiensis]|uniref:Uncharacterized protein n=1 Tax=Yinghuangia aomiensis TaxID=676205 RepID=A0ABP9HUK7_9ACTN